MKRFAVVLAILLGTTIVGSAQYRDLMQPRPRTRTSSSDVKLTFKGYIVDSACAKKAMPSEMNAMGQHHMTACDLKSLESGLGIVTDGAYFAFDEKGTKKAADLLKKTNMQTGFLVEVIGTMRDGKLVVSNIKEVKP